MEISVINTEVICYACPDVGNCGTKFLAEDENKCVKFREN